MVQVLGKYLNIGVLGPLGHGMQGVYVTSKENRMAKKMDNESESGMMCCSREFPYTRVPFCGVLMVRILMYWALCFNS